MNMIHHINKMKDKNHSIVSIDAEIKDSFMMKFFY